MKVKFICSPRHYAKSVWRSGNEVITRRKVFLLDESDKKNDERYCFDTARYRRVCMQWIACKGLGWSVFVYATLFVVYASVVFANVVHGLLRVCLWLRICVGVSVVFFCVLFCLDYTFVYLLFMCKCVPGQLSLFVFVSVSFVRMLAKLLALEKILTVKLVKRWLIHLFRKKCNPCFPAVALAFVCSSPFWRDWRAVQRGDKTLVACLYTLTTISRWSLIATNRWHLLFWVFLSFVCVIIKNHSLWAKTA